MINKNKIFLINAIKFILLILINAFAFLYSKNKSIYFYFYISITDIIILISFSDIYLVFKNKNKEYVYKYFGFVYIIFNFIVLFTFLISFLFEEKIFKSIYFVLFYDSIILLSYVLLILFYKVIICKSSIIQRNKSKNHMFFKLLKNEIIEIKDNINFPSSEISIIDNILDFVEYSMTISSSVESSKYEQQISRCLCLCDEMLSNNSINQIHDVLIEMEKILKRRERELKSNE